MADNSRERKKALIVSVLAFLFAGGGIFLFFVIQGANELSGKSKAAKFTFGQAAREGVSSFFSKVGLDLTEEAVADRRMALLEEKREDMAAAALAANADISDWMKPSASAPTDPTASAALSRPTKVPSMQKKPLSGVDGAGSGGSNTSGSITRYGAGSGSKETSVSSGAKAPSEAAAKGAKTLDSLKNSQTLLASAVTGGSAMSAKNRWDQSFGAAAGQGKSMGYGGQGGLVKLDRIKNAQVEGLKMDRKATPLVSASMKDIDGTKEAFSGDAGVQRTKDDLNKKIKKQAAMDAANTAGNAVDQDGEDKNSGAKPESGGSGPAGGSSPDGRLDEKNVPPEVKEMANSILIKNTDLGDGTIANDTGVSYFTGKDMPSPDGSGQSVSTIRGVYSGEFTSPDGVKTPYTQTVIFSHKGEVLAIE